MFVILADTINWPLIIGIAASAVAIILILFVLLYLFVFQKNKLRRQIRELDRRFEYLHALLIGQDAQYVKRLEIVSRTNLLYVDTHTRFLKKFKEVRDKHDANAQSTINNLKDLLDEKKYKLLKEALQDSKEIISCYEKEVNTLNSDLLAVVKPEEECRQNALSLKEQLRRIKQDYYSKQGDLQLVSESFEEVFHLLDSKFEEFESFIESAHYDDANSLLPQIDRIIRELSESMSDLPNYCALVVSIIPDKLASLENAYEILEQEKYPLHHLVVNQSIKEMKDELNRITYNIKRFELKHVSTELDNILSRIDEFFVLFNEEKEAREVFERENDEVYATVNDIERKFIKLCNNIPEVKKIYKISEEEESKINEIQNSINIQGAFKRSLDTFIHSSTKQPYSVLMGKMKELKDASAKVITEMQEFQDYLDSLKIDSEKAFELVYECYEKNRLSEAIVHEMNVPSIANKYSPIIERAYELVNLIYEYLNVLPIDVELVNQYAKELRDIAAKYFDDGEIKKDLNMMLLAENTIEITNRDRAHLSDINQLSLHSEELFFNGEFEAAYLNALKTIKRAYKDREE